MKEAIEIEIEVRYAESDQMGIVHHANYLVWFEVARTRLCLEAGYHYAAIEEMGYWLVVTGSSARYRTGARYGDTVTVCCELDWVGTRVLQFAYVVRRGDERIATGTTEHVWVARDTGRHCRIPEKLLEPFLRLSGQKSLIRRPQAPS